MPWRIAEGSSFALPNMHSTSEPYYVSLIGAYPKEAMEEGGTTQIPVPVDSGATAKTTNTLGRPRRYHSPAI